MINFASVQWLSLPLKLLPLKLWIVTLSLLLASGCSNNNDLEATESSQNDAAAVALLDADSLNEPITDTASQSINQSEAIYRSPDSLAPLLKTPVVDLTNTLSVIEREALESKILDIYKQDILQIGVVIVPTTGNMPIYDYAMQVARLWALGDAKKNNGLLILMSTTQRDIYILTGIGVETVLPNERVKHHIDSTITPAFKRGQFAQGLTDGIDAIVEDVRTI